MRTRMMSSIMRTHRLRGRYCGSGARLPSGRERAAGKAGSPNEAEVDEVGLSA